jgi:hypothetical protein
MRFRARVDLESWVVAEAVGARLVEVASREKAAVDLLGMLDEVVRQKPAIPLDPGLMGRWPP